MLEVNNIEVAYKGVIQVLRGVSLKVGDGSIVALMGANGAGKSTTLKAISGLLDTEEGRVTDGAILWDGRRIDQNKPEKTVKLGISQVIEGRRLFEHLSVEDNLRTGAYARPSKHLKKDLSSVYGYFPKLYEMRKRTSGYLSGGEQQMLVIGRALMNHPKLMLLDEPSMGLSPVMAQEIFEITKRINQEENTSILLVEQNAQAVLEIAEFGYVLENGRVVLEGPADQLRENEDVKEFYLGLTAIGKKSYRDVKHYRRRKRWLS